MSNADRSRITKRIRLFVIPILVLLAGCAAPAPQTIEVTRIVRETVQVTQIIEIVVTATPVPPTATPEATATPDFMRWTVDQTAGAISAAGLEFVNPQPMTVDDYGGAPLNTVEAVRFLIPSLCADCGGRLYSFGSQPALEAMKTYYDTLGQTSAWFFSWVFVKDNILLQINGDLPESQALQYKTAIEGITAP